MTAEELKWSLCCLCRTNDGREIRSPAQSKCKDRGARYESLSNALSLFEGSHSSIPMNIPKFLLNDANLQQTLMINNARFQNPA